MNKEIKHCIVCGIDLPIESRPQRLYCSQKCSARNNYLNSEDKYKARQKSRYEKLTEEQKLKTRKYFKDWYALNKKKQYANIKRWQEEHPEKWAAIKKKNNDKRRYRTQRQKIIKGL